MKRRRRKSKRRQRGIAAKQRALVRRAKRLPNRGAALVQSQQARKAALQGKPQALPIGSFLGDLDSIYLPKFGPAKPAGIAIPRGQRRAAAPSVFLPGGAFDPIG